MQALGLVHLAPLLVAGEARFGGGVRAGREGGDLLVQDVAHAPVERARVRPVEHHGELVAVAPVRARAELLLHALVEERPGQRVGDGDADVVGPLAADEVARREEVRPGLARVAELEEPRDADAVAPEEARRRLDLADARALVHRVEDPLRAGLDAHPDLLGAGGGERRDGRGRHEVDARLHRERDPDTPLGERLRVGLRPARREAEDVVREPEVVRAHRVREQTDLVRDVAGAALGVARAPERLRAPVAVERAAARRHDVPGEPAVRARPRRPVGLGVHEVPGRQGQGVEVLEEGPRRRAADGRRAVETGPAVESEAADGVERSRGVGRPRARRARPSRARARRGSRRRRRPRGTRRRGPSRRRRSRPRGTRARARRRPSRERPRGCASCTSSSGS